MKLREPHHLLVCLPVGHKLMEPKGHDYLEQIPHFLDYLCFYMWLLLFIFKLIKIKQNEIQFLEY